MLFFMIFFICLNCLLHILSLHPSTFVVSLEFCLHRTNWERNCRSKYIINTPEPSCIIFSLTYWLRSVLQAAVKKGFQVMKDSKQDTPDKRVSELVSRYLRDSLTPDQMATLTKLTSFGGSFSREGATFVLQVCILQSAPHTIYF